MVSSALFTECTARGLLLLTPPWDMVSETGALSALVTPVSVKGGQMQLVSQVDLSAVISVEKYQK